MSSARHTLHPLVVTDVAPVADDAVVVHFDVPDDLEETFAFLPGQHLAVSVPGLGDDLRRSYSICSTVGDPLRIGVKLLPGGRFSGYVRDSLRPGAAIDVLPPAGRFVTTTNPSRARHVVAIAAGSGITPVYSILASVLADEPHSRCTLIFGNRTASSIMFLEDIEALKNRCPERFQVFHVLTRETRGSDLLEGRIDSAKLRSFLGLLDVDAISDWFLCGPPSMLAALEGELAAAAVAPDRIHRELFHAEDMAVAPVSAAQPSAGSEVSIVLDGRMSRFTMPPDGSSILEAALRVRPDAPYACKGGVCGTCRCRLVSGEVEMTHRYALEDDEVGAGIRLACQSVPTSSAVVVDFDQV